ncbi:MAG TPA: methyltransferase domain-containing protein [Gammaproteobacteria bacterium]|nr:methyltransferase domain-containing protein [Gammaproteobacteria bacterium]
MANIDKPALKQREHDNWASAAEGWRRRDALLTKGAAPVTERMLELSGICSGSRLLDIASGTGEPSISAAQIVGDSGQVVGTDLVEEMLIVAREKVARACLENIEYHCKDAEILEFDAASFDAVTIRWGLMFMPDPLACLTAAYRALKPGGNIVLACWAAPEKNPFVGVMMQTLGEYMDIPKPPVDTPGIFAFADPVRLEDVLKSAGFSHIKLEEAVIDVIEVADGRAYWEAMSDLAAPVMALVRQLDESVRIQYIEKVIEEANGLMQGDTLAMKGTTWIACAGK